MKSGAINPILDQQVLYFVMVSISCACFNDGFLMPRRETQIRNQGQ